MQLLGAFNPLAAEGDVDTWSPSPAANFTVNASAGAEEKEEVEGRHRVPHTIAGPLCFAGDVISRNALLPPLEPRDWVGMMDAGANTLSLFSRHCSRPAPLVLGFRNTGSDEASGTALTVLKAEESLEDLMGFWGGDSPSSSSSTAGP